VESAISDQSFPDTLPLAKSPYTLFLEIRVESIAPAISTLQPAARKRNQMQGAAKDVSQKELTVIAFLCRSAFCINDHVMISVPTTVVTSEEFDELFLKEANVVEFANEREETLYSARHIALKQLLCEKVNVLFEASGSKSFLVDDEWWPDHTQRIEFQIEHCMPETWNTLHGLLTTDFRDYRILISVYADLADSKSHVGAMLLYLNRIVIDRKLFLLLERSELQRQFAIRLYLWAQSKWTIEIANSFPRLRTFKSGYGAELFGFIRNLDYHDQVIMAQSLLKRSHFGAVAALGETKSAEEQELLSKFLARHSKCDDEPRTKKSQRASKKKICSVMAPKFLEAFGNQCFGVPAWLGQDPELDFEMRLSGWIIGTRFYFGERSTVIHFSHFVTSEMTYELRGAAIPVVTAFPLGITSDYWIGVDCQTEWQFLANDQVVPACDSAIELCHQFYGLVPKLLTGLDLNEFGCPPVN